MKIICINTDNTMEEIDIDTSIDTFLSDTNIEDIQLLYYWNYGNIKIKCYGLYLDNYSNLNSHSLPSNGISPTLDENSDNIILSDKIYICAFNKKENLVDYCISDYGNFYYVINEQNQFDNDDDSVESDDILEKEVSKINKEPKIDFIHNNNNILGYDNNEY